MPDESAGGAARTHVHPVTVRIATGEPLVTEVAMAQTIAFVMTAGDLFDKIIAKGMGS